MKAFSLALIFCFVHHISCVRIDDGAKVDRSAFISAAESIERGAQIDACVVLKAGCKIEMNATVKEGATIGQNSLIEMNSIIGKNAVIHDNVHIEMENIFGGGVSIGNGSRIKMSCRFGKNTVIHNDVRIETSNIIENGASVGDGTIMGMSNLIKEQTSIKNNASIGNNVEIAKRCIVNANCKLGTNVKLLTPYATIGANSILNDNAKVYSSIGEYVYVGKSVKIGSKAEIGNNAVIYTRVSIPENGKVLPHDVIIPTPTSYDLYADCVPLDQILEHEIKEATGTYQEFDKLMGLLITQQMFEFCDKIFDNFKFWKKIKSLYLIRIHGVDGFEQNRKSVAQVRVSGSSVQMGSTFIRNNRGNVVMNVGVQQGFVFGGGNNRFNQINRFNEESDDQSSNIIVGPSPQSNFGPGDDRINEDLKESIKKLLAIEHDSKRSKEERVSTNENISTIFKDILTRKRKVKFDSELLLENSPIDPSAFFG